MDDLNKLPVERSDKPLDGVPLTPKGKNPLRHQKKGDPRNDFVKMPMGSKVYDKGEATVAKMNREQARLDPDIIFQELYENYLVSVERGEERVKPNSKIILRWDMSTSFGDFVADAIDNVDNQLEQIKFAKSMAPKKFRILDDSILSDMKIDSGSSIIGQKFSQEDYEVLYELMSRTKEYLREYASGRLKMIVDSKTGRVRVAKSS